MVTAAVPEGGPVAAGRSATGVAHRDQVAAIGARLGAAGAGITVDN